MFYSASTGGFYIREIHGDGIPTDAVEITVDEHRALLEGQAQGKVIAADVDGRPVLQDRPPPGPPQEVSMQKARRALHAVGQLAAVEAAIDAMPEPQRTDARIQWEYSATVQRNQPLVLSLGESLGLDLDALFIQAAAL